MPAAEKNGVYIAPGGTMYKVIGFASHVTNNDFFVLYSRLKKNGSLHEEILAEPLEKFTKNSFERVELIDDTKKEATLTH